MGYSYWCAECSWYGYGWANRQNSFYCNRCWTRWQKTKTVSHRRTSAPWRGAHNKLGWATLESDLKQYASDVKSEDESDDGEDYYKCDGFAPSNDASSSSDGGVAASSSNTPETESRSVCWVFRCSSDDAAQEKWQPYQVSLQEMIENAYESYRSQNPQDGESVFSVKANTFEYELDFAKMTQKNLKTSRCRPIRREDLPCATSLLLKRKLVESHSRDMKRQRAEHVEHLNNLRIGYAAQLKTREATISDLQTTNSKLIDQNKHLSSTLDSLKIQRLQDLKERIDTDRESARKSTIIKRLLEEMEIWRCASSSSANDLFFPLCKEHESSAEVALRSLSHSGPASICSPMASARVLRVERICNPHLYDDYKLKKARLKSRSNIPSVTPKVSSVLRDAFKWLSVSDEINETLLFHGSTQVNMRQIARDGFEARVSKQGSLYGLGVYFAPDSCKSFQYCDKIGEKCIIVARVLLGHAYAAAGPMTDLRIPPHLDPNDASKGRYDSVVANEGIPNGTSGGTGTQSHREFVIFEKCMAYPELAIFFDA
eukprot:TRINITY_DN28627_c0_g1_i1.p1 TRINITY_DN28627_c0_g1~~TRINITY_DN28627_c0_g1_i1.p1  ORF type:complete len:580 (-),score=55.60 TRINITY_DN28627_c0_g1_i1:57-1685(-)